MTREVCEHHVPVDLPCAKCEKPPTLRDDIIRMAREAGLSKVVKAHPDGTMTIEMPHPDKLERFAALVAAAEREECAKVCDEVGNRDADTHAYDAATAIRARGNT